MVKTRTTVRIQYIDTQMSMVHSSITLYWRRLVRCATISSTNIHFLFKVVQTMANFLSQRIDDNLFPEHSKKKNVYADCNASIDLHWTLTPPDYMNYVLHKTMIHFLMEWKECGKCVVWKGPQNNCVSRNSHSGWTVPSCLVRTGSECLFLQRHVAYLSHHTGLCSQNICRCVIRCLRWSKEDDGTGELKMREPQGWEKSQTSAFVWFILERDKGEVL